MIFKPTLKDGWTKTIYPIKTENDDEKIIRYYQINRWGKDGIIIEEEWIATTESPNRKWSGPSFWLVTINNRHPMMCEVCSATPEIRIDKKTKKFYCTCSSSFISPNAEIGDKYPRGVFIGDDDPDYTPQYILSPQIKTFETINEAVKYWNQDNVYFKALQNILKYKTTSNITNPKIFLNEYYKKVKNMQKSYYLCRDVYAKYDILCHILYKTQEDLWIQYDVSLRTMYRKLKILEQEFLNKYFYGKQKADCGL